MPLWEADLAETRIQRAIATRDVALNTLRKHGTWQNVRGPGGKSIRVLMYKAGDLQMLHRTPFQRFGEVPPYAKYLAALYGSNRAYNLPYALDVWFGKKVLNIEWADDGRIELVSYKPGDWERTLQPSPINNDSC
jgi:hypothetical protein